MLAYASRHLSDAESRNSMTEQECLAVVWAVKKFCLCMHVTQFKVVTNLCFVLAHV